jgi:hypothetical protein
MVPFSPFLLNLDIIWTEHYQDGSSIVQGTPREWARNIMSLDDKAPATCDVVNGGTDQLSFRLSSQFWRCGGRMPRWKCTRSVSIHLSSASRSIKEKLEWQLANVQFSRKMTANLDFMCMLSTDMSITSRGLVSEAESAAQSTNCSDSSKFTASSVRSNESQASRPLTPAESLRQRYRDLDRASDGSTVDTQASDSSRSDSPSKHSSSQMSTTSAKF